MKVIHVAIRQDVLSEAFQIIKYLQTYLRQYSKHYIHQSGELDEKYMLSKMKVTWCLCVCLQVKKIGLVMPHC